MTTDVLEPLWLAMEERISRAKDIDEVRAWRPCSMLRTAVSRVRVAFERVDVFGRVDAIGQVVSVD